MNQRKAGALLSYINIIAQMIVGLVYTPVMLRLLGQSEYGLYSMIGSYVAYLSILDMGLGNTIIRYTAKNRVTGDKSSEAELNGLFLFIYSIIGVVVLFVGILFYCNIDTLFGSNLTNSELDRAKIMVVLLIFNTALTFPLSIFGSIMQAYERFIFLRIANILRVILQPLIVLPLLLYGYGSVMMVVVSVIVNIVCLLVNVYYCSSILHIKFNRGKYEKTFLMEVVGYSFFIFLNAIMDKIYWGSGQFVLGIVSGTIQVAIYAVAMQFMMMYMNLSTAISGVMLPKVTMMVANNATSKELSDLMIRIGRLQFLVVGFIFAMFVVVGESFIELWAGSEYLSVHSIVILLMFALLIPLIQNVGISILLAMNLNKWRMTVYVICAIISIIASFPAAKYWNGMGCAVCTAISLLISTGICMNWYYKNKINLDIMSFWKSIGKLSFYMLLFICVMLFIRMNLIMELNWVNFSIQSLICTVIYIIIMYYLAMNGYEKNLVNSAVSKIFRRSV